VDVPPRVEIGVKVGCVVAFSVVAEQAAILGHDDKAGIGTLGHRVGVKLGVSLIDFHADGCRHRCGTADQVINLARLIGSADVGGKGDGANAALGSLGDADGVIEGHGALLWLSG